MTDDVIKAVQLLHKRSDKSFYKTPYWTERIDIAIDIILRHPNSEGNPFHLVKNALSDSRKFLRRRSQICPLIEIKISADEPSEHNIEIVADPRIQGLETVFTIKHWLEKASLSESEQFLLTLLWHDEEAKEVAEKLGITVQQARVRISRARKRAKTLWEADTNV